MLYVVELHKNMKFRKNPLREKKVIHSFVCYTYDFLVIKPAKIPQKYKKNWVDMEEDNYKSCFISCVTLKVNLINTTFV